MTTMYNSIARFTVGLGLGLAVIMLFAFNILLLWVATGPRSLTNMTPYLEASLVSENKGFSVDIGETWLVWDGWRHPIDIRLKDVTVYTASGQRFSSFPQVSLGLDVFSLMYGRLLPTSLTLNHPVIDLYQNEDRSISFGFKKEAQTEMEESPAESPVAEEAALVPLAAVLAPLLSPDSSSSLRKLREVNIVNADVSVGNMHKGIFFQASKANINFSRDWRGNMEASLNGIIDYDEYQSMINSEFVSGRGSDLIEGEITVNRLMPGILAGLFADNPVLNGMQFPVSGKINMAVDMAGNLKQLGFNIDGGEGTLKSDKLDGPLPVTRLHVEGQAVDNAAGITLTKLNADFDGLLLEGDAAMIKNEQSPAIKANIIAKNIDAKDLHTIWPPSLAPMTREWIIENITEGKVPQVTAQINIAPGDIDKPALPREAVNANILLENAKVRYIPEHPDITHLKATIHLDGISLKAAIDSGSFLKDTQLTAGTLDIDDLNAENPYIKIAFDTDTNARDIVHFLGLPRLKHAGHLNLREDSVAGKIKGHAAVGFYFFAPKDEKGNSDPDIDYDVTAQLDGVSTPAFMKKFDFENSKGKLTVNNHGLEFKGSGIANGANVSDANVRYLFNPESGFDTMIEATATAPVESLPRFDYPALAFMKGTLGVKASVKLGANTEISEASIDLANTDIDMKTIGWKKPDKELATIDLVSEKRGGVASIKSFKVKGPNIDAKGSAELLKDMSGFARIELDNVRYGDTDLNRLLYEVIDGGFRLEAQGKSAYAAPWSGTDDYAGGEGTFSFANFPAVQIKMDISRVIVGKGRELLDVKGGLTCSKQRCDNANISGTTVDHQPFNLRILRNPKGSRQFSLRAQSAGAFLKAANVFDGMEGGDLTITGTFEENPAGSVLRGRADINEHVVKDAPVLAKLLSLASLTGFMDTLEGNGIRFTRLRAPFKLSNDVITLEKAKTFGSAMGMTADGTITFPKQTLDIEGTIVPSYSLNSVLGKVPLVGFVLTGGEGQGVFAANYSLKGSGQNPDVSVNPLSVLTPGFLRGLFDIFDKPKNDTEEEQQ